MLLCYPYLSHFLLLSNTPNTHSPILQKAFKLPLLAGLRLVIGDRGIGDRTRARLADLARQMGAVCDAHVTDACTHYVTNVIGGLEYDIARSFGTAIVTQKVGRHEQPREWKCCDWNDPYKDMGSIVMVCMFFFFL